ncbi:unnamed protein product [Blepharisma stoltei]|uniref:Uncharacterized protein n=1 Tax=Blepharisma stoltei TaxID=1481888 RepID=A0AAU9JME6_9CILI|nr:unnamed protein product [Blepharisma stoltei]
MSEEVKEESSYSTYWKVAKSLFTPVKEPAPIEELMKKERWRFALGYSVTFFAIPIFTITNGWAFKKFCGFHARLLRLQHKSPTQLALLSIFFATVYTSLAIPFYYKGLLRIFGLTELYDMAGVFSEYYLDGGFNETNETKNNEETEKKS